MLTEKEVAAKIREREHYPAPLALKKAQNVLSVRPALLPCVEKWFAGEEAAFRYRDVDLLYVRKKINCGLLDAVLIMDRMIGDDAFFEKFKRLEIKYR